MAGPGGALHGSFSGALGDLPSYLQQLVGWLGWLDTILPLPVYALFGLAAALFVMAGVCFGPRRPAVVTAVLAVAVVAIPLAIGAIKWPYFQSRYELGFAGGAVLVGALAIRELVEGRSWRWPARATIVVLTMVGVGQVLAFVQMVRRFTAGANGPWFTAQTPAWRPPWFDVSVLVVLFAMVATGLYACVATLAGPDRTAPVSASPAPPPPAPPPPASGASAPVVGPDPSGPVVAASVAGVAPASPLPPWTARP